MTDCLPIPRAAVAQQRQPLPSEAVKKAVQRNGAKPCGIETALPGA